MYLKNVELVGFKSFADRTGLEFGPGISAIVGPNGCGKSNISDAVRWVLGEQSARLLRGSKMEDCIFSGTDTRKPLGMAEVSLTLTDCESILGTEYHEMTVTRRVFRSGEGQYFINKTPCRLKDIQRLFMDTGVGTNSYSLMEQGRIDLILRARPEDRREVFEEASGITKYKADKREALRKLEQTEANLIRLADIIKEVKRQIISLQRQAGKAARYQKLHGELRRLDICAARERLQGLDQELQRLDREMAGLTQSLENLQQDIDRREQQRESFRVKLDDAEQAMAAIHQADRELKTTLDRCRQVIEHSQHRIKELQDMTRSDAADVEAAGQEQQAARRQLDQADHQLQKSTAALAEAEQDLQAKSRANAEHEQQMDAARQALHQLHTESMELENRLGKLQNELHKLENEDRAVVSRRERSAAEQANAQRLLESHDKRLADCTVQLKSLGEAAAEAERRLARALEARSRSAQALADGALRQAELKARQAAVEAQLALLNQSETITKGARALLDKANPLAIDRTRVLGRLADQLETPAEYRLALESALRLWLDAIVVSDLPAARTILRSLEAGDWGGVRLLIATGPEAAEPAAEPGVTATALADHISCPERLRPLVRRLLRNVRVVQMLDEVPDNCPATAIYVTRQGAVRRGHEALELYGKDGPADNPLARKHQLQKLTAAQQALQKTATELDAAQTRLTAQLAEQDQAAAQARAVLDDKRQALGRQEGETQMITRQVNQFRDNLETITWELRELEKQSGSVEAKSAMISEMDQIRARRIEIKHTLDTRNAELASLEQSHKQKLAEVMAANTRFVQHKQTVEHLTAQRQPLGERITQLDAVIRDRSARLQNYQASVAEAQQAAQQAQKRLPDLERDIAANTRRLQESQEQRAAGQADLKTADDEMKSLRNTQEEHRNRKSELNGQAIECRLNRQHLLERITADYRLAPDALNAEPEPEWPEGGRPALDTMDAQIAELRAKLEAMGPVNPGAIDEYQQLQERFDFLTHQQDDLLKSKQQLMDMIKKINQTTTEMFSKTFTTINENFQNMFQALFGGGTAKLILTDEEDILECGIEIFARPPGKRLQSISLLSGGESTMTAVALLFSIYMVKPSPFCVLDEMDAALDESNIHRFIKVLKGFLNQSQFVVITHNRQTIAQANVIYGVTMEADKVSKIVSMKFTDKHPRPAPADEKSTSEIPAPTPVPTAELAVVAASADPASAAVPTDPPAPTEPKA